jgi:predicted amidohydrolase
MNNLKIALIQMQANDNVLANLDKAESYIKQASLNQAKLVILPEFFVYIGNSASEEFKTIIEEFGVGKIQDKLKNWAILYDIYIVAGTIPIVAHGQKVFNTTIVYDNTGNVIANYNKIHLFKFIAKDKTLYNEADVFEAGNDIVHFNINDVSFGLAICYDIRFPELFRELSGVDAIIVPAAFMEETGTAHWEILLRARAIENQCYVFAVDQCGIHNNGRKSYGHTMSINPWGIISNHPTNIEEVIYTELSKKNIIDVREKLPALEHRRL